MRATASREQQVQDSRERHHVFIASHRLASAELSDVTIDRQKSIINNGIDFNVKTAGGVIHVESQRHNIGNIKGIAINTPFTGLIVPSRSQIYAIKHSTLPLARKLEAERTDYHQQLRTRASNPEQLVADAVPGSFGSAALVNGGREISWKVSTPTESDPEASARATLSRFIGRRGDVSYQLKLNGSTLQVYDAETRSLGKELAGIFKSAESAAEKQFAAARRRR